MVARRLSRSAAPSRRRRRRWTVAPPSVAARPRRPSGPRRGGDPARRLRPDPGGAATAPAGPRPHRRAAAAAPASARAGRRGLRRGAVAIRSWRRRLSTRWCCPRTTAPPGACGWPTRSPTRSRCCAPRCCRGCCRAAPQRRPGQPRRRRCSRSARCSGPGRDPLPPAPRPPVDRRPTDEEIAALDAALPAQPTRVAVVLAGHREQPGWWGPGRSAGWADAVEAARTSPVQAGVELTVAADAARARGTPAGAPPCTSSTGWSVMPASCTRGSSPTSGCRRGPRRWSSTSSLLGSTPSRCRHRACPRPGGHPGRRPRRRRHGAAAEVEAALRDGAGELLESLRLFDVYRGEQVGEGRKSLAYTLRFRAPDRTLTVEEVTPPARRPWLRRPAVPEQWPAPDAVGDRRRAGLGSGRPGHRCRSGHRSRDRARPGGRGHAGGLAGATEATLDGRLAACAAARRRRRSAVPADVTEGEQVRAAVGTVERRPRNHRPADLQRRPGARQGRETLGSRRGRLAAHNRDEPARDPI